MRAIRHFAIRRLLGIGLAALFSALLPIQLLAQPTPGRGTLRLLGGIGLGQYRGDLSSAFFKNQHLRPNLNVGLSYYLGEHLSVRGELGYYRLYGSDAGGERPARNLSFRTDNPEGFIALSANLLPYSSHPLVNLYVFAGIGGTRLSPKAEFKGRYYSLPRLRTEGVAYHQVTPIIPVGFGVLKRITQGLDAGLEFRYTFTRSDYLDDVSTVYPGQDQIDDFSRNFSDRSPEAGFAANAPGSNRGTSLAKDRYVFVQFRLEHTIGSSQKASRKKLLRCPKF